MDSMLFTFQCALVNCGIFVFAGKISCQFHALSPNWLCRSLREAHAADEEMPPTVSSFAAEHRHLPQHTSWLSKASRVEKQKFEEGQLSYKSAVWRLSLHKVIPYVDPTVAGSHCVLTGTYCFSVHNDK